MDERRRLRLQARRGAVADAAAGIVAPQIRVIESQDNGAATMSSGEEGGGEEEEDEEEDPFSPVEDEGFDVVDAGVSVSVDIDEDEFDP